jgi:hypothetical protein
MAINFYTRFFNIPVKAQFKFASGGLGPYVKSGRRHYQKNDGTRVLVPDRSVKVTNWPTVHPN